MAITQISGPQDFSPAYNPIELIFSSTNVAECEFQYIADLYINGVFAIRLKTFPQGANNYGYFRIEEVLQKYLSFDWHEDLVGFTHNTNSIISFRLEVRERYNTNTNCIGTSTLSIVLDTTDTYYAWNGGLSYEQFPDYTQTDYITTNSLTKFLTNSPSRVKVPSTEYFNLSFLQNPNKPVESIYIKTYDRLNNLLGTYAIDNRHPSDSPHSPYDFMLSVGVGPAQLNDSTLSVGVQPVYHENVHYYKVYLASSSSQQISETKEFEVDSRCLPYSPKRLWWLNRLGGFDAYSFTLKSTRNVGSTRNSYERYLPSDYDLGDRGETVLSVDAQERLTFTTNYVSQGEANWLEELFTSPEVRLRYPGGEISYDEVYSGAVTHNALNNSADFQLTGGVQLPGLTQIYYEVPLGAALGIAPTSGMASIISYNGVSFKHETNITTTMTSLQEIIGTIYVNYVETDPYYIPIVITSPDYQEKDRAIKYTIEARPAFKKNIQRQ